MTIGPNFPERFERDQAFSEADWLPPRRLGIVQLPRMAVRYHFDGVDDAARNEFMRYFDLYTQRGGG